MLTQEIQDFARGGTFQALGWELRGAWRWATARLINAVATPLALTGAATIDGVAVTTGDIVVETAQADQTKNGPWVANTAGAWTRGPQLLGNGLYWSISAGTAFGGTVWSTSTATFDKFVAGTSAVQLVQASGVSSTLTADRHKQPRAIGADLTGGQLVFALPSPTTDFPYEGLDLLFFDAAPSGSFGANALVVTGNGKQINGANLFTLGANFAVGRLRYNGGAYNVSVGTGAAAPVIQTGTATLVAGTKTINTGITVTAQSKVQVTRNTPGGTLGNLSCPSASRVVGGPGTGTIVLNSDSNTETSTLDWTIIG